MSSPQDVVPEWQQAASNILVAVGNKYINDIMEEILSKFQPGVLPHFFVVQTLANLSDSNGAWLTLLPSFKTPDSVYKGPESCMKTEFKCDVWSCNFRCHGMMLGHVLCVCQLIVVSLPHLRKPCVPCVLFLLKPMYISDVYFFFSIILISCLITLKTILSIVNV